MSEWLCEEGYKKACEVAGRELEIKLLPNVFDAPCVICGKVAKYLTSGIPEQMKGEGK